MGMMVLALWATSPEVNALWVTLTQIRSLMAYMMAPDGDTRFWTGCSTLPDVVPQCFHAEDGQCVETHMVYGCGGQGSVVVTTTGKTAYGWTMQVDARRRGNMRTEPATDSRPYHLILQLQDPASSFEWDLNVLRQRSEAWPERVTVNGTVAARSPAFLIRFKDLHISLGNWEDAETFVPLAFDGTLRLTTEIRGCPEGTFLVRTLGPLKLSPEDLSIQEGKVVVNGRTFVFQSGEVYPEEAREATCTLPEWPVP